MVKVEAVVIRERIETVIDAVEEATGHVGVTVVEAVGHGRQRGITHEYRGRVFESRFLPKALLTFLVRDEIADRVASAISDAARSGHESGDGLVWTSPVQHVVHNRTGQRSRRWSSECLTRTCSIAASTIWVVVTAVLVMFMQAGFAFLEAGLTRMKNAGHIAGKNVLIFAVCSLVYWMVGFGLAFGDGNGIIGTDGLLPVGDPDDRGRPEAVRLVHARSRARPATCSRSCSPASRSRSSGARWPSGRSSTSTSSSGSSSR